MAVEGYESGNFLGPTVLSGAVLGPGVPAYDSEVFGPVLCLVAVETLEEAIQFVNSCKYGNGTVHTWSMRVELAFRHGRPAPVSCLCWRLAVLACVVIGRAVVR